VEYASGSFGPALERLEAVIRRRSELNEPVRERLASPLRTERLAALDRQTRHLGCRLTALSQASEIIRDGLCGNGEAAAVGSCRSALLWQAAAALDGSSPLWRR
jgi:hypothetical protein